MFPRCLTTALDRQTYWGNGGIAPRFEHPVTDQTGVGMGPTDGLQVADKNCVLPGTERWSPSP